MINGGDHRATMTTHQYSIRPYRDQGDARRQYELWLRATQRLTRPWRSCLQNVEFQTKQNGKKFPHCRLYAETGGGDLLGYIGTHPPFNWIGSQHGPPSESLGWTIPFGFPWTDPPNEQLATELYNQMIECTPQIYGEFQRDIYIQRFRESWTTHLSFLVARGWRMHCRVPLIGRSTDMSAPLPPDLVKANRDDLSLMGDLCDQDQFTEEPIPTEDFQRRYDQGWIVQETFWRLGDRGLFVLEPRGVYAAVTVLYARPDAWQQTVSAVGAQAARLGCTEFYFTVETRERSKRRALEQLGFNQVDAGVYYVRDAD